MSRFDRDPHPGQVVLKLKTPYRDGTSHINMSPLEFMQRLAALVPRPRLHLIRFHGVLAPNARLRSMVAPGDQRTAASEKRDGLLRVESAISDFSGADAQIGDADYLFIRPPAAGRSEN